MYASHWCFDKRFNFRNVDDGHCVVFGFCVYATWAAAQMEPADAMAAVPWMHAIQKYSLMTATKTTAHGCNTLLVTVSKSHSVCEWMGVTAAGGTSHRGWQLTKLTSATMPVSLDCVSPRLFRLGINMRPEWSDHKWTAWFDPITFRGDRRPVWWNSEQQCVLSRLCWSDPKVSCWEWTKSVSNINELVWYSDFS